MKELWLQFCGTVPNALGQGGGPGVLDYIVAGLGAILVVLVCVFTVKFFFRPGERSPEHIKHRILHDDPEGPWS